MGLAAQADAELEREPVGQAELTALVGGVAGLLELVGDVVERHRPVVALDREDLAEKALEPEVLHAVLGRIGVELQKPLVAVRLELREVRHLERVAPLAIVADLDLVDRLAGNGLRGDAALVNRALCRHSSSPSNLLRDPEAPVGSSRCCASTASRGRVVLRRISLPAGSPPGTAAIRPQVALRVRLSRCSSRGPACGLLVFPSSVVAHRSGHRPVNGSPTATAFPVPCAVFRGRLAPPRSDLLQSPAESHAHRIVPKKLTLFAPPADTRGAQSRNAGLLTLQGLFPTRTAHKTAGPRARSGIGRKNAIWIRERTGLRVQHATPGGLV